MYNLAPKTAPWFEHLTDSVRALGEAAREWKLASTAASLAYAHADIDRHPWHAGKVTGQTIPEDGGWAAELAATRSPHMNAVFALQRHYLNAKHATANGYEDAALLFASGAAWAIRQVRAGEQPGRVVFAMDRTDQRNLVAGSLDAEADAFKEARYSEAAKLRAAYDRAMDCFHARFDAEGIDGQDYIADHEASEMHELWVISEGLADASYSYGLLAERALQFVLLGPKDAHRKQLAEQRAAQQQATTESEAQ
ncbi:hypothetical protein ABZ723_15620 [Streptomyces sp. NPDC006700]|uniref:hypothetical protein n=1 Tax=unclassified Streptomyces TaxID=2593676 RepID=UPI003403A333